MKRLVKLPNSATILFKMDDTLTANRNEPTYRVFKLGYEMGTYSPSCSMIFVNAHYMGLSYSEMRDMATLMEEIETTYTKTVLENEKATY